MDSLHSLEDRFRQLTAFCGGRIASPAHDLAGTIARAEKFVHPFINRWGGANAPSIRAQFHDAVERSRALDQHRDDVVVSEVDEILSILDVVHRQLMHWYGNRG